MQVILVQAGGQLLGIPRVGTCASSFGGWFLSRKQRRKHLIGRALLIFKLAQVSWFGPFSQFQPYQQRKHVSAIPGRTSTQGSWACVLFGLGTQDGSLTRIPEVSSAVGSFNFARDARCRSCAPWSTSMHLEWRAYGPPTAYGCIQAQPMVSQAIQNYVHAHSANTLIKA